MGFLTSLFGKRAVEDGQAQDIEGGTKKPGGKRASQRTGPAFPQLRVGEHLEVSVDGRFLLSGRIDLVNGKNLVIKREQNQLTLQVCEEGAEAYIRGFDNGCIPFDLKGIVVESTKKTFKVKDLTVVAHDELPHSELRTDFRLVISAPAALYTQEDILHQNPEECSLVNISAGGACIQSEFLHGENEVLQLKVQLMNYASMTFLGQVVRASEPAPGVFQYGFLFAELDDCMSKSLTKMLINIQTGNTNVHYRHGYGHW